MAKPDTKAAEKNASPGILLEGQEVPDFATWEELQVGFAPYWNPSPGAWFYGQIVEKDERDSDFVRYLVRAGTATACKRGPNDAAEEVTVKPGEYFSVSVYYSLRDTFDIFLESGFRPFIRVLAVKEVKTKTVGQTCWTWKVNIAPQDKKLFETAKMNLLAQKNDAQEFPPKELTQ